MANQRCVSVVKSASLGLDWGGGVPVVYASSPRVSCNTVGSNWLAQFVDFVAECSYYGCFNFPKQYN